MNPRFELHLVGECDPRSGAIFAMCGRSIWGMPITDDPTADNLCEQCATARARGIPAEPKED